MTLPPEDGIFYGYGELSEGFKEPVLKTGDGETHREFESHTLRQTSTIALMPLASERSCFFFALRHVDIRCFLR